MKFVELDASKLGNAPPMVVGCVWCGLHLATAVSGGSAKTGHGRFNFVHIFSIMGRIIKPRLFPTHLRKGAFPRDSYAYG